MAWRAEDAVLASLPAPVFLRASQSLLRRSMTGQGVWDGVGGGVARDEKGDRETVSTSTCFLLSLSHMCVVTVRPKYPANTIS